MTSRRLYVVNQSTLVTNADVKKMVSACNIQVRDHFAPAWGIGRVVVEYRAGTLESVQAAVGKNNWVIVLLDDSDQAGALGWHWQDDKDNIYGEVFARPSLQAGSTALKGNYAVSSVLSHEVLETCGDPHCNGWVDTGRGYMVALEVCDPVEADVYDINGVDVSDFVTPEWFDPVASTGEKFDYLGRCTQPLSMLKGGYWVQSSKAADVQKFGEVIGWEQEVGFDLHDQAQIVFSSEVPDWVKQGKLAAGRNRLKRGLAPVSMA